jgi:hypothetical protein
MDLKYYCDAVGHELTGWKARMYDVMHQAEKDRMKPIVRELQSAIDDLNERIDRLSRECPADWSEHRADIDHRLSKLNQDWKKVYGALGEEEYGLGGA